MPTRGSVVLAAARQKNGSVWRMEDGMPLSTYQLSSLSFFSVSVELPHMSGGLGLFSNLGFIQ